MIDHIGGKSTVILRNHGLLTLGPSVASAFSRIYALNKACIIQVAALAGGVEIGYPSQDAQDKVREQVRGRHWPSSVTGGPGNKVPVPQLAWLGFLRKLE